MKNKLKINWDKLLKINRNRRFRLRLIIVSLIGFILGLFVFLSLRPKEVKWDRITLPAAKEGLTATLYFTCADANLLVGEARRLEEHSNILERAKFALDELIKGPQSKDLTPTIPKDTRLRELYIASGVAYPDFSRELIKNHWGGTSGEVQTVYSIVNTLGLNFDEIRMVQILVEGKEIPTLAGHIDTSRPLCPDISLIKEVESRKNQKTDVR